MTVPSEPAGSNTGDPTAGPPSEREARASPAPSAAHLRLRAELMDAVRQVLRRRRLRQRDAAELFGVAQPRVSDLVRGKLALFSIDTLVDMLAAAGVTVEFKLRPTRTAVASAPPDDPARAQGTRGAGPGAAG
jgi:predicted XRE-type DNA-binding protein